MEYEVVVKQILNGFSLVLFITLFSVGLSIIFGMMDVINIAHGELFMMGAYTVYAVTAVGGPFWLGLVLAPLTVGLVGLGMEHSILRHLYRRRDLSTLLATWGFSVFFREAIQVLFTREPRSVANPLPGSVPVLGVSYSAYRLFVMVMAMAVIAAVLWLFLRTNFGVLARATIQNSEMAAVLGINVPRMFQWTFVLGAALAGLAGALLAPLNAVIPAMGLEFVGRAFFAVVVGGLGTILGVVGGGLIIGEVESIFSIFLQPTVAQVLVFVMVIILILVRPRGLFGRRSAVEHHVM